MLDHNPFKGSYVVERYVSDDKAKCPKCSKPMNNSDQVNRVGRTVWFFCRDCKKKFSVPEMFL